MQAQWSYGGSVMTQTYENTDPATWSCGQSLLLYTYPGVDYSHELVDVDTGWSYGLSKIREQDSLVDGRATTVDEKWAYGRSDILALLDYAFPSMARKSKWLASFFARRR